MTAGCQQPSGPLAPPRAFGYLSPTELASDHGMNGRRYLIMTDDECQQDAEDKRDHAAPRAVVRQTGPGGPYWGMPAGSHA